MGIKEDRIKEVESVMLKHELSMTDIAKIVGTTKGEVSRKLRGERGFSLTFMKCLQYAGELKKKTGSFKELKHG